MQNKLFVFEKYSQCTVKFSLSQALQLHLVSHIKTDKEN